MKKVEDKGNGGDWWRRRKYIRSWRGPHGESSTSRKEKYAENVVLSFRVLNFRYFGWIWSVDVDDLFQPVYFFMCVGLNQGLTRIIILTYKVDNYIQVLWHSKIKIETGIPYNFKFRIDKNSMKNTWSLISDVVCWIRIN